MNRQDMTALHFAARSGQSAVVAYLLSIPTIDAMQRDDRGKTALQAAAANGHDTIVDMLRQHS